MRSKIAIRTAVAAVGATAAMLVANAPAAQAAPTAPKEGVSVAAACVYINRTYADGASRYAEVKNRCSGTYNYKVVTNYWGSTSCRSIGGYKTSKVRTGGVLSPDADYIQYC